MISRPSSEGRRHVLVYKLDGGGPITGVMRGMTRTGVSLVLPASFRAGEVVRLILPAGGGRPSAAGRTIIGHVVRDAELASGGMVGINFAWEIGLEANSRREGPAAARSWWRRLFTRGVASPRPVNSSKEARRVPTPRPRSAAS